MYGLVNEAVRNLVITNAGEDTWNQIRTKAGVEVESFSRMDQYPDDLTYRLVGAASEVLGAPADAIMEQFGEFWIRYTGREGYGHLFDIAGNSFRDFLFNLDALHTRVGDNFKDLRPPSFKCEDVNEQTIRMHYLTERPGLCPMVLGLLRGLADHFETEVFVEHPVCSRTGGEHCEFLLTMPHANR